MRVWRTADGYLAEGGVTGAPVLAWIHQYIPEGPYRELRHFRRLGPSGEIQEVYDVRFGSIEDELYLIAYGVVDDHLKKVYLSVFTGRDFRVRHEVEPVLKVFRELPPEEAARVTSGPPPAS